MIVLTKIEPTDTAALDRVRELDTPALRAELAQAIGHTARHLTYLAAVWKELESRGENLSDLRTGIGTYLPLIASGAVLPETVIAFAGQSTLLRAVAALPIEDQRRIANGEPVPVVVKQDGKFSHRMLPASALPASLVRQVFGERKLRTETEQIALLSTTPPAWKPNRPVQRGKVVVDRTAGTVRIGRSTAAAADVIEALRAAGMIPA